MTILLPQARFDKISWIGLAALAYCTFENDSEFCQRAGKPAMLQFAWIWGNLSVSLAALIARMLLALLFGVAGLAKLVDRPGSRRALASFGIPNALVAPLSIILPLVELAVAATLLPTTTAQWGSVGALAILLVFLVGITFNLARGRRPDCHCFGQLHSAPVGWPTVVGNLAMATIAGFIIWQEPADSLAAFRLVEASSTSQILALTVAVVGFSLLAVEGWLIFHLMRQNGRLLLRIEALEATSQNPRRVPPSSTMQTAAGLPVGTPAPPVRLSNLDRETVGLDDLRTAQKPVMLMFSDPGCGPCNTLLPDIGRLQREHAGRLTVAVVSRGSPEANRAKSAEHGLTNVLLQEDREVALAYQAFATPSAVVVRPDGTIGSPLAMGPDAIRALAARTAQPLIPPSGDTSNGDGVKGDSAARRQAAVGLKRGDPAPELRLPGLGGAEVDLHDFRGRPALVLFWDPGCGFCRRMLDDLKTLERLSREGGPGLLVVSRGTVEANRAMGLESPIALDNAFSAGRQFGALGTPSAVLVDAHGAIASELAVGAAAILSLAKAGHVTSQTEGQTVPAE